MTRSHRANAVFWAAVLASAIGCARAGRDDQAARERRALAKAIERYSEAARAADDAAKRVLETWNAVMARKDVDALRTGLRTEVVPALRAYVEALRAVPTQTRELARIHGAFVEANRAFVDAVDKFAAELRPDYRVEPLRRLRKALDARQRAEQQYLAAIEAYYRAHGITLAHPEEAAPDAGHTPQRSATDAGKS